MNNFDRAIEAEKQDQLVRAAELYEEIISRQNTPQLDAFINLIFLYFEAQDHATQVEQNLSIDYVSRAYNRIKSLFEQAKRLYPESVELDFWKNYIFFVYPYGPAYDQIDPKFFQQKKEVIPYFLAYKPLTGEHSEQAKKIWELVKHGKTFKERYIRHCIEDGILGRFTG